MTQAVEGQVLGEAIRMLQTGEPDGAAKGGVTECRPPLSSKYETVRGCRHLAGKMLSEHFADKSGK